MIRQLTVRAFKGICYSVVVADRVVWARYVPFTYRKCHFVQAAREQDGVAARHVKADLTERLEVLRWLGRPSHAPAK